MSSSSAAATAEADASRRIRAVTGIAGSLPAAGRGQSEEHHSFWESPRRGAIQAANHKRACTGGRAVGTWVSDGPATDRSGRPCSTMPHQGAG